MNCFLKIMSVVTFSLVLQNAVALEGEPEWAMSCKIRSDKFDYVLPEAMRANNIDMWIVIDKGRGTEPLARDFGSISSNGNGIIIFFDRGEDRIERGILGPGEDEIKDCGVYDIVGDPADFAEFVQSRNPQRIGLNFTTDTELYPMEGRHLSDGLSHTDFKNIQRALGEPYASRLVSAEKLIAHYRGRRVATELIEFSKIAEGTRLLLDRALSNEVITPGVTTLGDISWWLEKQRIQNGFEPGWDATVYVHLPDGNEVGNTYRTIHRGDIVQIDYGIGRNNFFTDIKRFAYVMREEEEYLPQWVETAFDNAMNVRKLIRQNVQSGGRGREKLNALRQLVADSGFVYTEDERASDVPGIEVNIGMHAAGNLGHDAGAGIFQIYPIRTDYDVQPYSIISLEFIVFTPTDEWGGNKVPVNIEENVLVTPHGIEWLHVPQDRPRVIR